MRAPRLRNVLGTVLVLGGIAACPAARALPAPAPDDEVEIPGKIHEILPMDRIPAIQDPVFVPAKEAEIPDGARVIGVVIDGDARAYCPNILNHHEIVNDEIGRRKVAVAW